MASPSNKNNGLVRRQLGLGQSGNLMQVHDEFADMYEKPDKTARLVNQVLCGELVEVLKTGGDFSYVRLLIDDYKGWVCNAKLSNQRITPTHWVSSVTARVRRKPDDKENPHMCLGMGSLVRVVETRGFYVRVERHGWIVASRLKCLGEFEDDFVRVLKLFLGADYGWGARYGRLQDCSSTLQHAMHATGHPYPRDSKDQLKVKGFHRIRKGRDGSYRVFRGCIVFWKGHVGVVLEGHQFLHATGDEFNEFVVENFETVVQRRRDSEEGEILAVYRL